MKSLIAILLLVTGCCSLFGDAVIRTKNVDCSVDNLAATYGETFPELLMSGLQFKNHAIIANQTATEICCQTLANSAPSVGDQSELCVPPGTFMNWDNITIGAKIYCRGASLITSGTFKVQTW